MKKKCGFDGLRLERMQGSKLYKDGLFHNPTGVGSGIQGSPWPLLGEYFFGNAERNPKKALPLLKPFEAWAKRPHTGLRATWLGHSTVLLEMDGRYLLTDPVFGERASPVRFAGPRRFHPTPVGLSELPKLDAILLSHDHYDHLCRQTMQALAKTGTPVVTPLGVGAHLERYGFAPENIRELDWEETASVNGLTLKAKPAQHFSGRGTHDRNQTLWASWVIFSENHKVFFSGDTGLSQQFAAIGREEGPFDLVMLEVGAFHESWGGIHLGPSNALKVFDMLGGGTLLPVHWGTFNLALHAWNEPADTLLSLAGDRRVLTPMLGEAFEPKKDLTLKAWWR
jgi:L-ascorbate metabolism protein UlaG (beta-lactamase superfamily)